MTQSEAHSSTDIATQSQKIAAHLRSGKSITPLDALNLYGCFRLGARIWDLKDKGMPIVKRMVTVSGHKKVAQYSLI